MEIQIREISNFGLTKLLDFLIAQFTNTLCGLGIFFTALFFDFFCTARSRLRLKVSPCFPLQVLARLWRSVGYPLQSGVFRNGMVLASLGFSFLASQRSTNCIKNIANIVVMVMWRKRHKEKFVIRNFQSRN